MMRGSLKTTPKTLLLFFEKLTNTAAFLEKLKKTFPERDGQLIVIAPPGVFNKRHTCRLCVQEKRNEIPTNFGLRSAPHR